jgi:GNAT superfamily N-acetyltransferase
MLRIRPAVAGDVPLLLQLIAELAQYEQKPGAAQATAADLLRDGWGPEPKFRAVIAEWKPAAFALFFYNYSTWQGRPGLYLEDLFVRPAFRRRGIGQALLTHLAQIAVQEHCGRLQWQVLDWNTPAIEFYQSLGAELMSEWLTMRVEGEALQRLARGRLAAEESR